MGGWRGLHYKKFHNLHSSPSIIRTMRCARHVARIGGRRKHIGYWWKSQKERTNRWMDNIKMDIREIGWVGMDCTDLGLNRDQWRALAKAVMSPILSQIRSLQFCNISTQRQPQCCTADLNAETAPVLHSWSQSKDSSSAAQLPQCCTADLSAERAPVLHSWSQRRDSPSVAQLISVQKQPQCCTADLSAETAPYISLGRVTFSGIWRRVVTRLHDKTWHLRIYYSSDIPQWEP
jgi:hypothetical protein